VRSPPDPGEVDRGPFLAGPCPGGGPFSGDVRIGPQDERIARRFQVGGRVHEGLMPVPARARDVGMTFSVDADQREAVRHLDLEIGQGAYIGLVGASGAGKSTVIHLLAALCTPTQGSLEIMGEETRGLTAERAGRLRADEIGLMLPSAGLLPRLTALDNVAVATAFTSAPGTRSFRRQRAQAALEVVGMGKLVGKPPHQLTALERRRVGLARAIVNGPSLLLADEPTEGLTQNEARIFLDVVDVVRQEHNMATVIASQDPEVTARAHDILELRDGLLSTIEPPTRRALGDDAFGRHAIEPKGPGVQGWT